MRVTAEARATPTSIPNLRPRDGATCIAMSATQHLSDLLGTYFQYSKSSTTEPHATQGVNAHHTFMDTLMPETRRAQVMAESRVGAHRIQAARLHDSLKLELVTGDEASAQHEQRGREEVSKDYGAQKEDPGCWQPSRCPASPVPSLHTQQGLITFHGLIAARSGQVHSREELSKRMERPGCWQPSRRPAVPVPRLHRGGS